MAINMAIQDLPDRYIAATAAAGQAVLAVRSGLGIASVGIERTEVGEENPYRAFCSPSRFRGAVSKLRFLVAGEAAQVALNLNSFSDVCLLSTHTEAANVIRNWDGYWGAYPPFTDHGDDLAVNEAEEETKALIWLSRWQTLRRLRREPELSVVEALALELRDGNKLSGVAVERFIRSHCRSRNGTVGSQIPVSIF